MANGVDPELFGMATNTEACAELGECSQTVLNNAINKRHTLCIIGYCTNEQINSRSLSEDKMCVSIGT